MISCFSESSINVSHFSCSSYSNNTCISPNLTPSTQNSVSSVYKTTFSNQKQLLITVTWCKNHNNQGLTISFGDQDPEGIFRLNTNSRFFRKKKGSKLVEYYSSDESKVVEVEVFWDLSNAKYDSGPEPVEGFYIAILVHEEIALILGDNIIAEKLKSRNLLGAKVSLSSRREHCSGNTVYSTKVKFCESGNWHDILIRCSEENEGLKSSILSVFIDKKMVICVKRLQWNFRGNQTIFVDGLLVDFLWDVHNWFFFKSGSGSSSSSSSGVAVFMFRNRSGLDSRLWLEEKLTVKDKDRFEFSLLIYACNL